jgi:ribosomal protein S6--L-glutamate ligase
VIVRNNRNLKRHYHRLGPEDAVICPIVSRHLEQSMLIDLLQRGVACFPSPLAQLLNRSKTAQALLLAPWMPPDTVVIAGRSDLLETIVRFTAKGIPAAVTKQNHKHCGHGVRLWKDLETLYSVLGFSESAYPFVVQPFYQGFTDIRAIIAGDYREAYRRENPHSFRSNLSAGGVSTPEILSGEQLAFCEAVMNRGGFPYAHLDLWVFEAENRCYLSEIALDGGLKGARIDQKELTGIKCRILESLASSYLATGK